MYCTATIANNNNVLHTRNLLSKYILCILTTHGQKNKGRSDRHTKKLYCGNHFAV
jgi:hypothetical protein